MIKKDQAITFTMIKEALLKIATRNRATNNLHLMSRKINNNLLIN